MAALLSDLLDDLDHEVLILAAYQHRTHVGANYDVSPPPMVLDPGFCINSLTV